MPVRPSPPAGDGRPALAASHDSRNPAASPGAQGGLRLLDRVRREIRVHNYSILTESIDVDWIKRFIIFRDKRHPNELGASEVTAVLT